MGHLAIQALRSGSSGNAVLLRSEQTIVLVDCGLNGKTLAAALAELDLVPEDLSAVLITHEHVDHVSGLGVCIRRHKLPFYCTAKTLKALPKSLGRLDPELWCELRREEPFRVGDLELTAVPIPHDAADPVFYRAALDGDLAAVCTDLGEVTESVRDYLKGVRLLLLEANYNPELLQLGPYPYPLKERIRNGYGHLSNREAGELAVSLVQDGLEQLCLGHLSRENNYPELALLEVRQQLVMAGVPDSAYRLSVARRYDLSEALR